MGCADPGWPWCVAFDGSAIVFHRAIVVQSAGCGEVSRLYLSNAILQKYDSIVQVPAFRLADPSTVINAVMAQCEPRQRRTEPTTMVTTCAIIRQPVHRTDAGSDTLMSRTLSNQNEADTSGHTARSNAWGSRSYGALEGFN